MKTKIYIRADGNSIIGLGHLVRCIALAKMLENNFEIIFVSIEIPENIIEEIEKNNIKISKINSNSGLLKLLNGDEIVIIDQYDIALDFHDKIKKTGAKLVCIDDIHDKEFNADLIINHSPGITTKNYKAKSYTQFALGPDYVLLRPLFLNSSKVERKISTNETIFICFGGSDSKNLTDKCLEKIIEKNIFKRIIVVLGSAYLFDEDIKEKNKNIKNIEFHKSINENEMLALLKESDIAVVPSSGIFLEAMASGCKIISGMYVENQKELFNSYKNLDCFISAEDFSNVNFNNALDQINKTTNKTRLIDGDSDKRILKLFKQLEFEYQYKLRVAKIEDSEIAFNWASNPIVRQFSYSLNEIKKIEHEKWFENKLKDNNCKYFILEDIDKNPIGSIRFDILKDSAMISYLVDPKYHGKGIGAILLKKGIELFEEEKSININSIFGDVMIKNIPSLKAFIKLNFEGKKIDMENVRFHKKLYY